MPQRPDVEVLALGNSTLPGGSLTLLDVAGFSAGAGGGWVTTATIGVAIGVAERALYGDLSVDGSAGPSLLRRPETIGGYDQRRLGRPDVRAGEIAYLASQSDDPSAPFDSAWIDDTLIAQVGDPIGSSGLVWERFSDIRFGFEDNHWLRGQSAEGSVLARQPGFVVLATGDTLQLLDGPVRRIERFDANPTGAWAARVVLDDPVQFRQAMVINGGPLAAGGALVVERELLGPDFGLPGARWDSFLGFDINDVGRLTLQAVVDLADGTSETITIRGNRLIQRGEGRTYRDAFGTIPMSPFALYSEGADLLVEDATVVDRSARIDSDGDGVADAGFSLGADALGGAGWRARFTTAGIVGRCLIDAPGPGGSVPAVVRVSSSPVGADVCVGVPNSTFVPSAMTAIGSTSRAANDLTLVCVDLPASAMGYALAARQSGFIPAPHGSQGNLCLGGEIGRLIGDMFVTGETGFASVPVDLARIQRPVGTVSAMAGETWFFQAWHRDRDGAAVTSNFSSAVSVMLTQ